MRVLVEFSLSPLGQELSYTVMLVLAGFSQSPLG